MSTILSGGMALAAMLEAHTGLTKRTRGQIFPVIARKEATLPYIAYGMAELDYTAVKTFEGPFAAKYDIIVYAESYQESCEIAEMVLEAVNGYQGMAGGLYVRGCTLTGAEEYWTSDAYAKTLSVRIKIN